jgi:hypothetical protein
MQEHGMEERQFRDSVITRDRDTLVDRVKRWKQLTPATFQGSLPGLLWEYITEADDMYIGGHYIGVILLCSAILELVLADQHEIKTADASVKVKQLTFEEMICCCSQLDILDEHEKSQIDHLRKLRNALVHINAGKLLKMARKGYEIHKLKSESIVTSLYLASFGETGISEDALEYLTLARDITVKFYGIKE